jgi:hypothetical protein
LIPDRQTCYRDFDAQHWAAPEILERVAKELIEGTWEWKSRDAPREDNDSAWLELPLPVEPDLLNHWRR